MPRWGLGHGIASPESHAGPRPPGQLPMKSAPSAVSQKSWITGDATNGSTNSAPRIIPSTPMKRLNSPARMACRLTMIVAKPVATDAASDNPATAVVASRSTLSACLFVLFAPARKTSAACAWRNWNHTEQMANRIGPAKIKIRATLGSSARRKRVAV